MSLRLPKLRFQSFFNRLFYVAVVFIVFIYVVLNLGRFFDITQPPDKADIIVYLGRGAIERVEKALELYQLGCSKTDKIIFTGSSKFSPNLEIEIRANQSSIDS